MALTVNKTELFTSGPISFGSLRSSFKETLSGSVSASELIRNTSLSATDPIVPDATENVAISSSDNLKISQFRNSIKYYDLDQGSGDTDTNLDISDSLLWNNNLDKNIVKRVNLAGTSGSTNGDPAASLDAAAIYNVILVITGSILGTGGSAGDEVTNGGDGGHAVYVNTNSTGTVTLRAIGVSAQVYGGGGGGGGGGDGGTGGGGQYQENKSSYWANTACVGSPCEGLNPPFPCNGSPSGCRAIRGCQGGNTLYERYCTYNYTETKNTDGGAGGDGPDGGVGEGYLQSRTLGQVGSSGLPGGTNAGSGGDGGDSGDGGFWGEDGEDGQTGDTGNNGNRTNGTAGATGTLGGTAGRAVAGSGYTIDTVNGIESAYLGLK